MEERTQSEIVCVREKAQAREPAIANSEKRSRENNINKAHKEGSVCKWERREREHKREAKTQERSFTKGILLGNAELWERLWTLDEERERNKEVKFEENSKQKSTK